MTIARLEGIRVLDLTNVLAGPFCCHQLAYMGADVIKVEVPGSGDLARQLGADPDLNDRRMGVSFLAQNSGKRSITLNLKADKGKEVFRRLIETSDVLVENFRPGVMARLGLCYDDLKAVNANLIYCAISGFGQDGPLKNLPAYDQIIQGMSGTMSITGAPDTAPYRVGYPVADTVGGLTAAFAISSALVNRKRDGGCFIDVAMLDSVLTTMGWVVSNYLIAGKEPLPMGNDNFTASPSGTFETASGPINIAANKQEQFEAVCRVVGRAELANDERFSERQARLVHRDALRSALEEALAGKGADEWCALFNDAGVPAGPVLTVPEALAQPQVAHRRLIAEFDDVPNVGGTMRTARTGINIDGAPLAVREAPATLGQHTEPILNELGFDAQDIHALRNEGII